MIQTTAQQVFINPSTLHASSHSSAQQSFLLEEEGEARRCQVIGPRSHLHLRGGGTTSGAQESS